MGPRTHESTQLSWGCGRAPLLPSTVALHLRPLTHGTPCVSSPPPPPLIFRHFQAHQGTADHGHYYSLIRTDGDRWLEFNDRRVTAYDPFNIPRDCFGGTVAPEVHTLLSFSRSRGGSCCVEVAAEGGDGGSSRVEAETGVCRVYSSSLAAARGFHGKARLNPCASTL